MKKLVLAFLLFSSAALAQSAPPPTAEMRLAGEIARLTLQLAHAAEQIDKLKAELEELKKAPPDAK